MKDDSTLVCCVQSPLTSFPAPGVWLTELDVSGKPFYW